MFWRSCLLLPTKKWSSLAERKVIKTWGEERGVGGVGEGGRWDESRTFSLLSTIRLGRARQHNTHAGTCWLCMPARARARTGKSSHMQRWRLALRERKQLEMILHLHYNSINSTAGARWGLRRFSLLLLLLLKYARAPAASGYEDEIWVERKKERGGRSPCQIFGLFSRYLCHYFNLVVFRGFENDVHVTFAS